MSDDVGYKKPPKAHQWKPGQSGNKEGKAKPKPETIKPYFAAVAEVLKSSVSIVEKGKKKKTTLQKALLMNTAHKALAGNSAALKIMHDVMKNMPADFIEDYLSVSLKQLDDVARMLSIWGKELDNKSSAQQSPLSSVDDQKNKKPNQ